MNTFIANSTVNKQEAEALKEMIFNRARARAEAMNNETNETYVDSVQNDIMNLARTSFTAKKNPFSISKPLPTIEITAPIEETADNTKETANTENYAGLGFTPQNYELVNRIKHKNTLSNESIVKSTITATMDEAHSQFENKSSFMGALNFLNSQASIALVNQRGKRFNATA